MDKERSRRIASFCAEGHTFKEASQEFRHDAKSVRFWILTLSDEELRQRALQGAEFARKFRNVKKFKSYASYMAQIHTTKETMEKFKITDSQLTRALQTLEKYSMYENLVKMARAGAKCAEKRRR